LLARGVDTLAPVDTFLSAEYVIARFSLKGLVKDCGIELDKVHVKNGRVNLVIENGRVNLQRLFALKMDRSGGKYKEDKDLFNIKDLKVENLDFTMRNYSRRAKAPKAKAIDWGDLEIHSIDLDAHDFGYLDGRIKAEIESLSFTEKKGLDCRHLEAKVCVGHGQAAIEQIHIIDDYSNAYVPYFIMSCPDAKSFRKFSGRVNLDAEVGESRLDMRTLGFFAEKLYGINQAFDVSGRIDGCVNDLTVTDLQFKTPSGDVSAALSGEIKDIRKLSKSYLDLKLESLEATTASIEKIVRGFTRNSDINIAKFAPGEDFLLSGRFKGKLNRINGNINLHSTIGSVKVKATLGDLMRKGKPTKISSEISSTDFNVGKLLGVKRLEECSFGSKLSATIDRKEGSSLAIDSLMFDRLRFNGYDYTKIAAVGKVSAKQFDGKIISQDPALNFLFQGMFALSRKTQNALYQFYANVGHADLHAMNFDKRETSNLSFTTQANFMKVKTGDLLGNINVNDIVIESEDGDHNIGDIKLLSRSGGGLYRMNLTSDLVKGTYIGTENVGRFASDLIGLTAKRELPVLFKDPSFEWGGAQYDVDLRCVNTSELATLINPELYIDDDTSIGLSVYRNGVIDGRINTHRIALRDRYIKDLDCTIDNLDDRLRADLLCGSVSLGDYNFDNCDIKVFANDNDVRLGLSYDNRSEVENRGDLYALGRLFRNEADEVAIHTEIIPSAIVFENNSWNIMESALEVSKNSLQIDSLRISSGEQYLSARGGIKRNETDSLDIAIQRFDIGFINNIFKSDKLDIGGVLSGDVSLRSGEGALGYVADVVCDSTRVSSTSLGTVVLRSEYNKEFSRYDIDVRSIQEELEALKLVGYYTPASEWLDLTLDLKDLDVGFAEPFLGSVFSHMGGCVSGKLKAEGRKDSYRLYSENLRLVNTQLTVAYTHVPYVASGPVTVDEYGVYFDRVLVSDRFSAHGLLSGQIYYDHFRDMGLDIRIETDKLELINIPEQDKQGFYGNVYGTGRVSITGPTNLIDIDVDASTLGTGKGDLHIPLSNSGENKMSNLLIFKEKEVEVIKDRYEDLLKLYREKKQKKSKSNLKVHIRANATPDVAGHLELNKDTGNGLTGRGTGLIEIDVIPSKSYINYKGDYTLESGQYRFVIPNIATREFSIKNGSSIVFGGDLPESTLDIDAVYKTKASIATLISDTTSVNTRRAIECGINISDKLSNPQIKFSLDIPDLDPTVKSKVENALSTEDKVQRQILALLITNNFLPDDASGITSNTAGILYSNVSEIMSRQINNIFEKLDIPLDLGLKYQSNTRGNDIFDVALSTQLFNNRVIVGGNLGNRQYSNSNGSDITGDLDIEVKIDRPGALRLNVFSHHSDQYTNYLDNLQRNGLGITYQKEFNSFGHLIKYMFSSREKKEQMDIEEQRQKDADGYKTITISANDGQQ
ncbi:MAG: translocation/assembly module TamB, partial [Bacteroidales bacterium]|nr:translocation/assembly module TamB [Bacteroidales bacterium]